VTISSLDGSPALRGSAVFIQSAAHLASVTAHTGSVSLCGLRRLLIGLAIQTVQVPFGFRGELARLFRGFLHLFDGRMRTCDDLFQLLRHGGGTNEEGAGIRFNLS
jgi:hypothetical protein